MTSVLVTKPGTLTAKDRVALRKAGIVSIEADDPASVKLIQMDGCSLSGSDLFWAAMRGVSKDGGAQMAFASAVAKLADEQFAASRNNEGEKA